MLEDDLKVVEWLVPWSPVTRATKAEHLEEELSREVNPRHVLYRAKVRAVAVSDSEDVLFIVEGSPPKLALVHLTNSGKQDLHDNFPWTTFLDDVQAFVQEMQTDHEMRFGN